MEIYKLCEIFLTADGMYAIRKQSDGHVFAPRFLDAEGAKVWLDQNLKAAAQRMGTFRNAAVNNRCRQTRGL